MASINLSFRKLSNKCHLKKPNKWIQNFDSLRDQKKQMNGCMFYNKQLNMFWEGEALFLIPTKCNDNIQVNYKNFHEAISGAIKVNTNRMFP